MSKVLQYFYIIYYTELQLFIQVFLFFKEYVIWRFMKVAFLTGCKYFSFSPILDCRTYYHVLKKARKNCWRKCCFEFFNNLLLDTILRYLQSVIFWCEDVLCGYFVVFYGPQFIVVELPSIKLQWNRHQVSLLI